MRSLRRWVTFAVLTLGLVAGSANAQHPGYSGQLGGNPYRPGFAPGYPAQLPVYNAGFRRGPIGPVVPVPVVPPAVVVGQQEMLLMQQMAMHAKNLGDEISAINNTIAAQNGARFVIDPRVINRMMADPYVNTLVRTTLTGTPPRDPRPPHLFPKTWRPQTIEYMVTWRAIDVFFAANDWVHTPAPIIMQAMANRFSVMVPDVYFYIEAMRETYLINPVMQWPNAELPGILARMEGQLFVMRQLMDAIYCNAFFRPYFPVGWGGIEATFHAYRIDVRAGGALPIAPFPFYPEGFGKLGLVTPNFPLTPRPNPQPVLGAYDPQVWNGIDRVDPGYVDRTPIQGGGNVPGLGDPKAFVPPQIPNVGVQGIGNYRVGLPQLQPQGGGIPNGQPGPGVGQPGQGIPGQGIPGQQQGQPGFDQNYGLGDQQFQGQGGGPQQGIPQGQGQYGPPAPGQQQGFPQQQQPQQGIPQQQQQPGQGGQPLPNMPQQQDPSQQQQQPQTDNSSTADGVVWGNFDYQQPSNNQQQQQPQGRR